jgi:hypothetical protein
MKGIKQSPSPLASHLVTRLPEDVTRQAFEMSSILIATDRVSNDAAETAHGPPSRCCFEPISDDTILPIRQAECWNRHHFSWLTLDRRQRV